MSIPLYFQFRIPVYGRRFVADVRIRGRITCVEEYGATCIYGVNPGGLAAGGEDMNSAYVDFKLGLAATLFDLARDADTFHAFQEAATDFIAATDDESVAEWEKARGAIRAGTTPAEGAGLRRETEALPAEISVERLQPSKSSPALNPEPRVAVAPALEMAA